MAKKRKSPGTTIYLRDLRAKHVAACIRERMEGYLSGGKVKEKYGYYAWERIRRRLSGKRKFLKELVSSRDEFHENIYIYIYI